MTRRRDLLAVLALTGVVGGAELYFRDRSEEVDDQRTGDGSSDDYDGTQETDDSLSAYSGLISSLSEHYDRIDRIEPRPSFEYQPLEEATPEDDTIDAVDAAPTPDVDADRLVVTPAESATAAETYLREVFGSQTDRQYTTVVEDRDVTFVGGETGGVTYLLWSGRVDGNAVVLVGRGGDRDAAEAGVEAAISAVA